MTQNSSMSIIRSMAYQMKLTSSMVVIVKTLGAKRVTVTLFQLNLTSRTSLKTLNRMQDRWTLVRFVNRVRNWTVIFKSFLPESSNFSRKKSGSRNWPLRLWRNRSRYNRPRVNCSRLKRRLVKSDWGTFLKRGWLLTSLAILRKTMDRSSTRLVWWELA